MCVCVCVCWRETEHIHVHLGGVPHATVLLYLYLTPGSGSYGHAHEHAHTRCTRDAHGKQEKKAQVSDGKAHPSKAETWTSQPVELQTCSRHTRSSSRCRLAKLGPRKTTTMWSCNGGFVDEGEFSPLFVHFMGAWACVNDLKLHAHLLQAKQTLCVFTLS